MKIGIVVNSAWNIYNFRKGLVKSFIESGHTLVAIAPYDDFSTNLEDLGCEFVALNMENKGTNPLEDLKLIWSLYKIYKKNKLDMVLHFTIKPNIYGTLAARILNIPSINNVTGLGTVFIRQNFTSKIAHLLYKLAFYFPKKVFFQNKDDKQLFLNLGLIQEKITDLVPGSGVDTKYFIAKKKEKVAVLEGQIQEQEGVEHEIETEEKPFVFLLIARLLYDKGILEYIEAIKILRENNPTVQFQLLGKIDADKGLGISKEIVEMWQREGLITYLGRVNDVRSLIEEADCVVLPSYREGTPRTLLEAASMSKPLLATDVAGCREVVEHNINGFLCLPKNAQDLANKMQLLLLSPKERLEEMGKASRKIALTKFDQSIVIKKYHEVMGL
jgi:glycosyltransferase involved in cell wall biosynthesis